MATDIYYATTAKKRSILTYMSDADKNNRKIVKYAIQTSGLKHKNSNNKKHNNLC